MNTLCTILGWILGILIGLWILILIFAPLIKLIFIGLLVLCALKFLGALCG